MKRALTALLTAAVTLAAVGGLSLWTPSTTAKFQKAGKSALRVRCDLQGRREGHLTVGQDSDPDMALSGSES